MAKMVSAPASSSSEFYAQLWKEAYKRLEVGLKEQYETVGPSSKVSSFV